MSEVNDSDWIGEYEWDDERDRISNSIWETKDGTLIPVSDMSTNHIQRCIFCIKKYKFRYEWIVSFGKEWLEIFEDELTFRRKK